MAYIGGHVWMGCTNKAETTEAIRTWFLTDIPGFSDFVKLNASKVISRGENCVIHFTKHTRSSTVTHARDLKLFTSKL